MRLEQVGWCIMMKLASNKCLSVFKLLSILQLPANNWMNPVQTSLGHMTIMMLFQLYIIYIYIF